jgi:lipid-A-disaccharide synthase
MTHPAFRRPRVMIVAGEASGDLHGGPLAEALRAKRPEISLVGFGGKAMRAAGVDVRLDIERLAVVGFVEVLTHFSAILSAYRTSLSLLDEGVDVLVLIDYPGFNLRLARAAKARNIPVVYYVSPQIWAWRAGRIKTIAERVDRMLVVFPFEKKIYDAAGVPCEFVGHPLLDDLRPPSYADKRDYLKSLDLIPSAPTVALLPGSRVKEVTTLLPVMLDALEKLAGTIPTIQAVLPVAPSLTREWIERRIAGCAVPIRCVEGELYNLLGVADVAIVASGTATLQVALAGVPMVIVYKVSALTYLLARWLIRIPSVGLVNIVAGEACVPELIQADASPERLTAEVLHLFEDASARERMRQRLKGVASLLGEAGAAERVARAVLKHCP